MNVLQIDTVQLSEDRSYIKILDQTLLPGKVKVLHLNKIEDIWEAIKMLRVRGAPAIGVAAAYGIALTASKIEAATIKEFYIELKKQKDYLASSRPTAVNLFWALDRMEKVIKENMNLPVPELKERLLKEAQDIRDEDVAISRNIGRIGFGLLKHGDRILTHCNAGTFCSSKYGTALAPVYIALENGWNDIRIYCDETRPLLQGARLTAFEMQAAGVDTTLICDNMASAVMKSGKINIVFVGCDRVACNGDTANKIGTSGVAILCRYYGIPFYVCAPSSTIDMSLKNGSLIPIEERKPEEVTEMWYKERMAPKGIKVFNPAFDITDHELITGIITEKGLCHEPYGKAFESLGIR